MPQFKCTYHNLLEYVVHTVEAKSKAAAIRQLRNQLAPMCQLSIFTEKVKVERVKVPKVQSMTCPVCDDASFPRSEYVHHVRTIHP